MFLPMEIMLQPREMDNCLREIYNFQQELDNFCGNWIIASGNFPFAVEKMIFPVGDELFLTGNYPFPMSEDPSLMGNRLFLIVNEPALTGNYKIPVGIDRPPSGNGFAPIALSHFLREMKLRSYAKCNYLLPVSPSSLAIFALALASYPSRKTRV
jgi:hypothetical protein